MSNCSFLNFLKNLSILNLIQSFGKFNQYG